MTPRQAAVHAAPVATEGGRDELTPLFRLGRHPWRVCAVVAGCFFVAISLAGLVQGGDPSPVVGAVEALAVFAGFAAFGRLLGLRR